MRLVFLKAGDPTIAVLGLTSGEAQSIADGTHEPTVFSLAQCVEQGYALPTYFQLISEKTDAEIEKRITDHMRTMDPTSAPELVNLADIKPPWETETDG